MALYFEICGKIFKVRESIVIGRGAPFTNLTPHLDVSRTHAKLYTKKNKVYLMDLNSDEGTFVNNLKLKPNKAKEVKLSDKIFLGKQELKLSDEEDDRAVKRVLRFIGNEGVHYRVLLLCILAIVFLIQEPLAHFSFYRNLHIFLIGIFSIIFLMTLFRESSIVKKFYPTVRDIILGGDGFTFHYSNGQSYSVKFSKVRKLVLKKQKLYFTSFDNLFCIEKKRFPVIYQTILKRNSRFQDKKNKLPTFDIIGITTCVVFSVAMMSKFELAHTFIFSFFLFFLFHNLLSTRNPKMTGGLYFYQPKDFHRSNIILSLIVVIGMSFFQYDKKFSHIEEDKLIETCLASKDLKVCSKINFKELYDRSGESKAFKVLVKYTCELGVEDSCFYVGIHNRLFNSEKK